MVNYTDESSSSYFGEEEYDDDQEELFNDEEEVGSLLQACRTVEDLDSNNDDQDNTVEEITVADDEFSEYTLRSGQERSERTLNNHTSFSTVPNEQDEYDEETEEECEGESSSHLGETEYVEESSTAEEVEEFIDQSNSRDEYEGEDLPENQAEHTNIIKPGNHEKMRLHDQEERLKEIPDVGRRDTTYHDERDQQELDVEEQREKQPFMNSGEEILFEAEKNGIYYQGQNISRGVVVAACLATAIFAFMAGFLSAFWANPHDKSRVSLNSQSNAPNYIDTTTLTPRPTSSPTFKVTSSPTTSSPSVTPTSDTSPLGQTIAQSIGQQQISRSQEKALYWIAEEDEQQLTADDPTLVQRFLLANFYFTASSWGNGGNWLTNSTECLWTGVQCDSQSQVTSLNLTGVGITSSIPTEIQYLTALQTLDLSFNSYVGLIPDPLSALAKSRRWLQSDNIMHRKVPALQVLDLSHNSLYGYIPSSLGLLSNLISIKLGNNSLNGTIPESIGKLAKLSTLDVSNNTLHGELPAFSGVNLTIIDLGSNNISGNVDEIFCAAAIPSDIEIVIDCDDIECSCCDLCLSKPSSTSLFSLDKQTVDSACGRSSFFQDDGKRCEEICAAEFFECCNPFVDIKVPGQNDTNLPSRNVSNWDSSVDFNSSKCSFEAEVSGCMAYSKCQSLTRQADPAPANLVGICSFERLQTDPDACKALCSKAECCFSPGLRNCLTNHFEFCMDWVPCQNLRMLDDETPNFAILPTAPRQLEFECSWEQLQPQCKEICEVASCCSTSTPRNESCFLFNFLPCLTYLPCSKSTDIKISIPPKHNHVLGPCGSKGVDDEVGSTCGDSCEVASCCFMPGEENCFLKDPLGCLAWSSACFVDPSNSTADVSLSTSNSSTMTSMFGSTYHEISAACGRGSLSQDGGMLCKELCEPDFPEYCRPFHSANESISEGFGDHIKSCVDYAKCHVILDDSVAQPAPASLSVLCSIDQLGRDPEACISMCREVECCFSADTPSCLVENFNLCMDFAPCQNLRMMESIGGSVLPAVPVPRSMDVECLHGINECSECEKATCCNADGTASCLRSNFISCLTYASCPPKFGTLAAIPTRFSLAPQIPVEVAKACSPSNETVLPVTDYSCAEYCGMVSCCFTDGEESCFGKDPLGCLEWGAYCQNH